MPVVIIPPATRRTDRLICREAAPAMRQRGRVMLLSFDGQQARFAALNPQFAGPDFRDSAQHYLERADKARAYDARVAARDLAFQDEDTARDAAFRLVKPLYYAVGQVWPETTTKRKRLQAFGRNYYEAGRTSASALLELLNLAVPAAQDTANAALLAGKGWGAPELTALLMARTTLQTAHETAGRQVGLSGEEAEAYYGAQNDFYWFLQQLNEAADVLFDDEPKLLQEFQLTAGAPDRLQFSVGPGQTKVLPHAPLAPDRVLRCSVRGPQPDPLRPEARIWLDFLPVEEAEVEHRVALEPTAPYRTQKVKAADLGSPGPLLAVQNLTDQDVVVRITFGD